MSEILELAKRLPKAELHMHVEGSLEPEMMLTLSERNQVALPYSDIEEINKAYNFNCLQDFLDLYYQGMSVLQTEQDFFDLTWAYLLRCQQQNVVHTEIFFDPQGHTGRGIPFAVVMGGIQPALRRAESELGISSRLIMCFLRHLDQQSAFDTLEEAQPWLSNIAGVGLDSSEVGHPPSGFRQVFERAAQLGLRRVAHAGEEGPPEYVYEALDLLQVDRIDHGNRSLEDPELVRRLAESEIPLTVCPLSNLRLAVVSDMREHPARVMLESGLNVCINSDDPSYFGGYVNENFEALIHALDLTADEVRRLVANGFRASFLPAGEIERHLGNVAAAQ
ncbi:MAG: adenosine deaminase [Xanthomonadales bacterium]|nr:adenosine deaminase [Gammaproteobacteria bacterium]NNE04441.1 adenosine deaminase [Xanthomonadales bacterium]NNL94070.1 adenosine deaminase [Xanthomonadales bacterium]